MKAIVRSLVLGMLVAGCSSSNDPPKSDTAQTTQAVTYYGDVLPILEQRCLGCHQAGGIAPLHIGDYATAKSNAAMMAAATATRIMPPWGATSDGSCGEFDEPQVLTDEQIATIGKWAATGAAEGSSRALQLPELPALTDGKVYSTPLFSPVIQGGALAQFDEYRCFLMDTGVTSPAFITGYEVQPGTPEIVHHVLGFLVDPDAAASDGSGTNAQRMAALDNDTPDRDGWPCFGMAGEGIQVSSLPVTWAPGQGIVKYPGQSGVPIDAKHKLVIQVHFNLADPAQQGKTDQTRVKLQLASSVPNVGLFALPDPFLRSLSNPAGPYSLEPGQASTKFTWRATVGEIGLGAVPQLSLWSIGPHMHQRGQKFHATVGDSADAASCAVDVQHWDFHWQRLYNYVAPRAVDATTPIEVTCDYDTTDTTTPVSPGWGTRNEMCLAVLYFTTPLAATAAP